MALFCLAFLGSLITSLTGLGGGSLILACLLVFYSPGVAIALHSFTQLFSNIIRAAISFRTVHWPIVWAYGLLLLPGTFLGVELMNHINPSVLKMLIGSFLLLSLCPFSFKKSLRPGKFIFILLGAASGFLSVFVGAVGPLVLPFFNQLSLGRESVLTTKSAGQVLLQLSKIIAFWKISQINFIYLSGHILALSAATFLGVLLSIPIARKISDEKFAVLVNFLLGLIAVKILLEGIREFF